MTMTTTMIKRDHKKGYSIVEVVIALAIIVTVSITAISIVNSSIATKTTALNKAYAQSFADNLWESFKAAETQGEFVSFVSFAEGVEPSFAETRADGSTLYKYYLRERKITVEATVNYPEDERSELTVSVTDKKGRHIISFSYQKGDGI